MTVLRSRAVALLAFGFRHMLIPVMLACAIFSGAAFAIGLAASWWAARPLRASPATPAPSRGRRWTGRAILVVGCFVVPIALALFHAVPYAVERGLASGIERAAPAGMDLITTLASRSAMDALGVRDEDTALDVAALKQQVASALGAAQADQSRGWTWRGVQAIAQAQFLALVQRVLAGITDASVITWREVTARAVSLARSGGGGAFATIVVALRSTASAHVLWAALLVAATNAVAFAAYRLIAATPPTAAP